VQEGDVIAGDALDEDTGVAVEFDEDGDEEGDEDINTVRVGPEPEQLFGPSTQSRRRLCGRMWRRLPLMKRGRLDRSTTQWCACSAATERGAF